MFAVLIVSIYNEKGFKVGLYFSVLPRNAMLARYAVVVYPSVRL